MAPTDGRRGVLSTLDALLKVADDAFSECDWESAVFFSELAVALQPSDSKARVAHCRSLFASREYSALIRMYKNADGHRSDTQLLRDLVARAQVLVMKEDCPEFSPSSSAEWLAKGLALRHKEDGIAAWKAFLQSWKLKPLNIAAQRAVCHSVGGFYGSTSTKTMETLKSAITSMALDQNLEFLRRIYLQAACGALPDSPEISARSQQTKLSESRAASTQSLRSTSGGSRRPASQQICASRLTPSPSSHSVYLRSLWVRDCAVNHTDMRKGLEVARDIVAKAPDNLDISPVYVDMLVKFGTTDATDEIFLYADNLLNEGKTSRRSADRPEPWYAAGMYHHAAALQAGGNFAQAHRESARRFLARALEVSPSFGPAWIALGRSFAANDESDRAIQAYRSATKHCPDWHVPWLLIGIEHLRVGSQDGNLNGKVDPQHATALTYLERARDMAPADPEVRNQIGIFHSKTGHHEQAIASFTEAVDMENSRKHSRALPHSKEIAKYHNNLAFSLCQSGRLEEATEACLRALKTVSNGNCSEAMEAHQLLAFVLSKRGYSAQAIDNYHQAIGIGDKAQGSVSTRAAHSLVNRLMRDLSQEGIPGCLPLEHLVRTVECQMKTDK